MHLKGLGIFGGGGAEGRGSWIFWIFVIHNMFSMDFQYVSQVRSST